jgi:hypothetical protein
MPSAFSRALRSATRGVPLVSAERYTAGAEFRAEMAASGITGTYAGVVNALADLVNRLDRAVAEETITQQQRDRVIARAREELLPPAGRLRDASPDEFLAVFEWVLNAITALDERPEEMIALLDENSS